MLLYKEKGEERVTCADLWLYLADALVILAPSHPRQWEEVGFQW